MNESLEQAEESARGPLSRVVLGLRVSLEIGIVLALGYWGAVSGEQLFDKVLLSVGAVVVGFGVWGLVDFRHSGRHAEWFRLAEELIISGLAALAIYTCGLPDLAWALVALSLLYHLLVYLAGYRLLKAD